MAFFGRDDVSGADSARLERAAPAVHASRSDALRLPSTYAQSPHPLTPSPSRGGGTIAEMS